MKQLFLSDVINPSTLRYKELPSLIICNFLPEFIIPHRVAVVKINMIIIMNMLKFPPRSFFFILNRGISLTHLISLQSHLKLSKSN